MTRIILALIASLWTVAAQAQPMPMFVQNTFPVYIGPGDIVPGAAAWYGTRAYSAANARSGSIALRLQRISDWATLDVPLLPSGGVSIPSMTTFCAGTTCYVPIWYDQTGNGHNAIASSYGSSGATAPYAPSIDFSCPSGVGINPCLYFNGGSTELTVSPALPAMSQPATISAVVYHVAGSGYGAFVGNGAWSTGLADPIAGIGGLSADNSYVAEFIAAESTWHTWQAVINGNESFAAVDGATEYGYTATTSLAGNMAIGNLAPNGPYAFVGYMTELGIWPSGMSTLQTTLSCEGQTAAYGMTSCVPKVNTAIAYGSGGPCDVIAGGCAEAYSVTRAMAVAYTGPLFQISNGVSTLDIGQTSGHIVDLSTWSSFCNAAASSCRITKIYAQVHGHSNDLVPAIPINSACATNSNLCASALKFDPQTGLPILWTNFGEGYYLAGDAAAVGINTGNVNHSVMYNGRPAVGVTECCGNFGLAHQYQAGDVIGTDYLATMAYGNGFSNFDCGANTYCAGDESESAGDLASYEGTTTTPWPNGIVHIAYNATTNTAYGWINAHALYTNSPPNYLTTSTGYIFPGASLRLGVGGDLSQPAQTIFREGYITNGTLSGADVTASLANMTAFYAGVVFP